VTTTRVRRRPLLPTGEPKPRFRGISHLYGFWVALALGAVLVVVAPGVEARVLAGIYSVCAAAMLGCSALLHRGSWNEVQDRYLRQLDHSSIFLMIAGTYTPVTWYGMHGLMRWVVLAVVWCGAIFGITMEWAPIRLPRGYITAVYLIVGWTAVIALPWLWESLGVAAFLGVVLGGVLYTIGAVIHAARKPDPAPDTFGYHEIFHVFVLLAASVHYCVIAFAIIPRA